MRVQFIQSNQVLSNTNKQTKVPELNNLGRPINRNASKQTSFKGLVSVLTGLLPKIPKKNLTSEAEVIKTLAKSEFGAYGLTSNGYKFITPQEYKNLSQTKSIKEIVIKNSISRSKIRWGTVDGKMHSEIHSCRKGISPLTVIDAIENGFRKMSFICDDALHVLTLPEKNLSEAKRLFEEIGCIDEQLENTIHIMPKFVPDYLYNLASEMLSAPSAIKDGFKLEKFPLQ